MTGSVGLDLDALAGLLEGQPRTILAPVTVVHITGPDSRRFANGMFTNNVRDLPIGGCNRHAMVDDRGRVGGFLDLICLADDAFVAVLDEGVTAEGFAERYDRYVVFDDVELEARSWQSAHVLGGDPPAPGVAVEAGGGWVYATWGWPGPGRRWVGPAAPPQEGQLASPSLLDAARLLAGVPRFPEDTGPKGLPHELGLREVLLAFDKGCYLGQESINRIDVMGNVRKRLRGVVGPALSAGAEVSHDGVAVGTITRVVELPGGARVGLAVIKEPALQAGTAVHAGGGDATVVELPVARELVRPS